MSTAAPPLLQPASTSHSVSTATHYGVKQILKYIKGAGIGMGILSFFLIAGAIYFFVLINQNTKDSAQTFGNVCATFILLIGIIFAVLSWIMVTRVQKLGPFVQRFSGQVIRHVGEQAIRHYATQAANDTADKNGIQAANALHKLAQHPAVQEHVQNFTTGLDNM